MKRARALFSSQCVSDEQTCQQIASTWRECEYLLDPHSAIGVKAALDSGVPPGIPVITLATAHPAKFPEAVRSAGLDQAVVLPTHLSGLFEREERLAVLPNDLAAVQAFIATNINA
jgi:threonine synthase